MANPLEESILLQKPGVTIIHSFYEVFVICFMYVMIILVFYLFYINLVICYFYCFAQILIR